MASYFNQLLDDLRAAEQQKLATLRELHDLCEHDLRRLDAAGARLQTAPLPAAADAVAAAAMGGLVTPDAREVALEVQAVRADKEERKQQQW